LLKITFLKIKTPYLPSEKEMCTYYENNKVKKNYCKMQTECNMFTLFFNVHLFLNTQINLTQCNMQ